MRTILIIFLLFGILNPFVGHAQKNEKSDAEIIAELMIPTVAKTILLLSQKTAESQIIIVCKAGSITITYGEILDIGVPTWESLSDLLVKKILPQVTKHGVLINSIYDKYLMRDINQDIDLSEAAYTFGLNLIVDDGKVKTYLVPENNEIGQITNQSDNLVSDLLKDGVDTRDLMDLYGAYVNDDYSRYVSEEEFNTERAIDELTNVFEGFDVENAKKYNEYLQYTRMLVEAYLESKKQTPTN